jgi:hypothetical protein
MTVCTGCCPQAHHKWFYVPIEENFINSLSVIPIEEINEFEGISLSDLHAILSYLAKHGMQYGKVMIELGRNEEEIKRVAWYRTFRAMGKACLLVEKKFSYDMPTAVKLFRECLSALKVQGVNMGLAFSATKMTPYVEAITNNCTALAKALELEEVKVRS